MGRARPSQPLTHGGPRAARSHEVALPGRNGLREAGLSGRVHSSGALLQPWNTGTALRRSWFCDNNRAAAQSPQPDSFARMSMGACIMRICGNGPAAVRRGAVGIGAGRDFVHSMEANALVQQTSRGRFGILRRRSPADRLRPDSAPRIPPAQAPKARLTSPRLTHSSPSGSICHWFSRPRAGDSAYCAGAPPPTGSGPTARRASCPYKHQRRGSHRRTLPISSPSGCACHWFSRPARAILHTTQALPRRQAPA